MARGLIVGGGNTKLAPMWNALLLPEMPKKLPSQSGHNTATNHMPEPAGLLHVPDDLKLLPEELALVGGYDRAKCKVQVKIRNTSTAEISYSLLNSSQTGYHRPC